MLPCRTHEASLQRLRRTERYVPYMSQDKSSSLHQPGTGFFDASIAAMDTFVSVQGKASPFAMLARDATQAARENARLNLTKLRKSIMNIHIDFHNQFAAMIEEDTNGGNVSDIEVRRAIAELLEEEMPKLKETKAQLEAIKASFNA